MEHTSNSQVKKQEDVTKVKKDRSPHSRETKTVNTIEETSAKVKPTFFKSLLRSSSRKKQSNQSQRRTSPGSDGIVIKKQKSKLTFVTPGTPITLTDDNDNIISNEIKGDEERLKSSNVVPNEEATKMLKESGSHHNIEWNVPESVVNPNIRDFKKQSKSSGDVANEGSSRYKSSLGMKAEKKITLPVSKKNQSHEKLRSSRHRHQHHHHDEFGNQSLEQEKITLDKAAIILYEEEKAKEKLKASVADLTRTCEKYRYDLKLNEETSAQEILKLQLENEALLVELSRTNEKLNHWKAKCQRQENEVVNLSKLKIVTKENANLKEDLEVLKSVTKRLNQEIAFYQDKLRIKYASDPKKIPIFSTSSDSNGNTKGLCPASTTPTTQGDGQLSTHNYEILEPRKNLLPLLTAYDEVIEEKNELIKDHEIAMERFKANCQEIVQENEDLHKIIGEAKETGTISIDDWQFLHDNAVMVLEENDILHDQIKVLKKKADLTSKNHEEKVDKLKGKMSLMEEETVKMKTKIKDAHEQCSILAAQISKMTQAIQHRIPIEEHEASVRECSRLFEELKRKYIEETKALAEKIRSMETEKQRLANELTGVDAEKAKLRAKIISLEETLSVNNAQLSQLQADFSNASKIREGTEEGVNEMIELTKTAFAERESLQVAFHEQKALNDQLMSLRRKETELVEELRQKIKLMENVHQEEMEKYRNHILKLEEVLESVGQRHQADILHFKELISEKSTHIEKLGIEKQQLMEDLETVWKATTRDANKVRSIPSTPRALQSKFNSPGPKLEDK